MQIASHHAKYAREGNRLPGPPDDAITAQFLAIADWPKLQAMLCDLAAERKEAGYSYGWYVTVALQRIHGLLPARLREIRARLKDHKGMGSKNTAEIHQVSQVPVRRSEDSRRKPLSTEQSTGRPIWSNWNSKSVPSRPLEQCDDLRASPPSNRKAQR